RPRADGPAAGVRHPVLDRTIYGHAENRDGNNGVGQPAGARGLGRGAEIIPTQVKNYLGAAAKSARTGRLTNTVVPVTVFGVPINGPIQYRVSNASGGTISPWSYVSTNPTNNANTYDLWMDVYYSGKTNRISNWSV